MRFFKLLLTTIPLGIFGQEIIEIESHPLPIEVQETSGLILFEDCMITHNDSGDGPTLYEIDPLTALITRRVHIANAESSDWEDICKDEEFIYIGDFGNNAGIRTDLKIYRISIYEYEHSENDTIYCDTIQFSYADQTSFEPALYETNFDAEAFISKGDSLYIFTKNWGNFKSNIYPVSKYPGTYELHKTDSINSEGLVTAADYDPITKRLVLIGYQFFDDFILYCPELGDSPLSSHSFTRFNPDLSGSIQIEGVTLADSQAMYISSEQKDSDPAILSHLKIIDTSNNSELNKFVNKRSIKRINSNEYHLGFKFESYQIFNQSGSELIHSNNEIIDLSNYPRGIYILHIQFWDKEPYSLQIVNY